MAERRLSLEDVLSIVRDPRTRRWIASGGRKIEHRGTVPDGREVLVVTDSRERVVITVIIEDER
jgi:hypothetical protein